MSKAKPLGVTIAENLKRVMDAKGLSQNELGRLTGLGQSTLSRILDLKNPSDINPRTSTLEVLAKHFSIPAWTFLIPNAQVEVLLDQRLGALLESFAVLPVRGRETVLTIADNEARYAAISSDATLFSKSAGKGA